MAEDHSPKLTDDERESMAIKAIAEQTAMLSNLAYSTLITNINLAQQNAVSNQQAMNQIQIAVTGKIVNLLANLSPLEAVAVSKLDTNNNLADQLANLKAALAASAPSPTPEANDEVAGQ